LRQESADYQQDTQDGLEWGYGVRVTEDALFHTASTEDEQTRMNNCTLPQSYPFYSFVLNLAIGYRYCLWAFTRSLYVMLRLCFILPKHPDRLWSGSFFPVGRMPAAQNNNLIDLKNTLRKVGKPLDTDYI
jgi:hypothetical protein